MWKFVVRRGEARPTSVLARHRAVSDRSSWTFDDGDGDRRRWQSAVPSHLDLGRARRPGRSCDRRTISRRWEIFPRAHSVVTWRDSWGDGRGWIRVGPRRPGDNLRARESMRYQPGSARTGNL